MTAALMLLVPACAAGVGGGPPSVQLGFDLCSACGMAISDGRYAGAIFYLAEGRQELALFDDIGCMARWEAARAPVALRERWVHDRSSVEWMPADVATFARSEEWNTPMGSGLAAFRGAVPTHLESGSMRWRDVVDAARRTASEQP